MINRRRFGLWGKSPTGNTDSSPATIGLVKREYLLTIDIFRELQPDEIAAIDRQTDLVACPQSG